MDVLIFSFPGKSVNAILENHQLSEDKKEEALDKMLNANPDYLELPQEEQYGLIASTLTLEVLVYWVIAQGELTDTPTMYNAYMETGDIATIEFMYVNDEDNAQAIDNAFKAKDGQVIDLPRKQEEPKEKGAAAPVIPLRKDDQ